MKLNKRLKFLTIFFFTTLFLFSYPSIKSSFAACAVDTDNSGTCVGPLNITNVNGVTIVNSGTINTSGGFNGIRNTSGASNTTIINSGTINTPDAVGIFSNFSNFNTIINSGTIDAGASTGWGIYNSNADFSTIINSGTINAGNIGIRNSSNSNTVINSGTINTRNGFFDEGISNIGNLNTVINSGTINTISGNSGTGIRNNGNLNTITNSGKIISETAIRSSGQDNILNIEPQSYIGGAFNLDTKFGASTTVNINTGPSHSILYNLANTDITPTFSGSEPGFFKSSTSQAATYDPSGFKGTMNELGDLTNNLSRAGLNNLSNLKDKQFQLATFGGKLKHDGDNASTLAQQINQRGVSGSYNFKPQGNVNLNIIAGYVSGNISVDSRFAKSYDIDSEGPFAGLLGVYNTDLALINFGLTAGKLKHKNDRFVNDNTITDGASQATASYHSTFFAPQIGISKNFNSDNIIYKPSANVRYNIQSVDGYTETGTNGNATIKSYTTGVLESNIEIAATKLFNTNSYTIKTGYLNRQSMGDNNTSVTMIGQTNSISFGDKSNNIYYTGVGADLNLANFKLSFDLNKYLGDAEGFQGMVKLTSAF
jgi:hypothetical protein